ncbi:hypothetical protein [Streptomyces sp. NPDC000880]
MGRRQVMAAGAASVVAGLGGVGYAEDVGWLMQDSGNELAALAWTQRAVEPAEAGGGS